LAFTAKPKEESHLLSSKEGEGKKIDLKLESLRSTFIFISWVERASSITFRKGKKGHALERKKAFSSGQEEWPSEKEIAPMSFVRKDAREKSAFSKEGEGENFPAAKKQGPYD